MCVRYAGRGQRTRGEGCGDYERDRIGFSDIRASRLNIRLAASRLLPFKSGRRSKIASSSALAAAAERWRLASTITVTVRTPLFKPPWPQRPAMAHRGRRASYHGPPRNRPATGSGAVVHSDDAQPESHAIAAHLGRLLPIPTPGERLHRRLARPLVAVRRSVILLLAVS